MTHISEIGISTQELDQAITDGWVRVQRHPSINLFIYNYTELTQYRRYWNKITMACRGLILDNDYNIVARPWKKFFNLGEGLATIDFTMPVEVTDKLDGSLGIVYHDPAPVIATRGSFASEQAQHGTQLLQNRYHFVNFPRDYTFLFEIIYPNNRVVVDYGKKDDLFLLGAVNIQYGYYLGPRAAAGMLDWPGPVAETFEYISIQEAFRNNERPNAEGYVIRSGSEMLKLKQADYVELHRILSNLNDRTIWRQLGEGRSVADICEILPDEMYDYVRSVATYLNAQADEIEDKILNEYLAIPPGLDRKSFAAIASKSQHSSYLFSLYDGRSIREAIWTSIKPEAVMSNADAIQDDPWQLSLRV